MFPPSESGLARNTASKAYTVPGRSRAGATRGAVARTRDVVVGWLLAATVAWLCVLMPEVVAGDPDSLAVGALYVAKLSGMTTLLASLPVALPHLIRVARARQGGHGVRTSTGFVALMLIYPAWQQAAFLTSGDSVADSPWQLPLRIALFVAAMLLGTCLWWWHLRIIHPRGCNRRPHNGWIWLGLWILGAAGLAALYHVLRHELRAYAYFARTLMLAAWLVSASLLFPAVLALGRRTRFAMAAAMAVGVAWAWLLVPQTLADDLEEQRNLLLREAQLVALTDLLVHTRDTSAASYDLTLARQAGCPPTSAASNPQPLGIPKKQRRNVILISFDALRADVVHKRVAPKDHAAPKAKSPPLLMPNLAAFASDSLEFTSAITTYPATLMAVGSALTGLSASDILFAPRRPDNIFRQTRARFDRQAISLPTSPWFSLPIIDALFVQGTPLARHGNAHTQTRWLISQLRRARRAKQSIFAWVHFFEPHKPYRKHREYDYGPGLRARYYSELASVDAAFGRLIRHLQRKRWLEESLVVVFSDHGQALGERSYSGHHVYLNSWVTDIPLMLHVPGGQPARTSDLVEIADVAPTVLHFAGIPYPETRFSGRSLLSPRDPKRVGIAEAFPIRGRELFELTHQRVSNVEALTKRVELIQRGARNYLPKIAAIDATHRLIVNRITGARELYDRRTDRQERHEISRKIPKRAAALEDALSKWTRRQSKRIYCGVSAASSASPSAL